MTELYESVIEHLPAILAAVALVLAGWLLATLLRSLLTRVLRSVTSRFVANEHLESSFRGSRMLQAMPRVTGAIVYWLTILLFVSAAVERLEFTIVAGLLGRLTEYLPNVLLAAVLLFLGILFGRVARQTIGTAAATAGISSADLIGRMGQISIVLIAAIVAADQIGVQSTFLMLIIGIATAMTLGGVALAFGIGSGPVMSNIIASYYVRGMYRAGQNIRIGDLDGRIIEIRPSAVTLDTPDGRVQVPCRRFIEEVSVLLRET